MWSFETFTFSAVIFRYCPSAFGYPNPPTCKGVWQNHQYSLRHPQADTTRWTHFPRTSKSWSTSFGWGIPVPTIYIYMYLVFFRHTFLYPLRLKGWGNSLKVMSQTSQQCLNWGCTLWAICDCERLGICNLQVWPEYLSTHIHSFKNTNGQFSRENPCSFNLLHWFRGFPISIQREKNCLSIFQIKILPPNSSLALSRASWNTSTSSSMMSPFLLVLFGRAQQQNSLRDSLKK